MEGYGFTPMNFGVSTACFYPMDTEKACVLLAEHGVLLQELFVNCPSDVKGDALAEIRRMQRDYGLRFTSMHPFTSVIEGTLFFSDSARRFADGCDIYRHYFLAAASLDIPCFVFHGQHTSKKAEAFPFSRTLERFELLRELAWREFGVVVAQENVVNYQSGELAFLQQMKEQLPDARFVLDFKQAVRMGVAIKTLIQLLGERIVHLHLSDHQAGASCLPPFTGVCDYAGLFQLLEQKGYQGSGVIELYRENFQDISQLLKSLQTFNERFPTGGRGRK